jgi:hypothetical protein
VHTFFLGLTSLVSHKPGQKVSALDHNLTQYLQVEVTPKGWGRAVPNPGAHAVHLCVRFACSLVCLSCCPCLATVDGLVASPPGRQTRPPCCSWRPIGPLGQHSSRPSHSPRFSSCCQTTLRQSPIDSWAVTRGVADLAGPPPPTPLLPC